ncbi:MAG: hypothetical protein QXF76_02330 [Candidatus Anstonellales archaeon]
MLFPLFAFYNKITEFGKIISCACIKIRKKLDLNLKPKEICIIRSKENLALLIIDQEDFTSFVHKIEFLNELVETSKEIDDKNNLNLSYLMRKNEVIGFMIKDFYKINKTTILFSFPLKLKLNDDSFISFDNVFLLDNFSKAISIVLKTESDQDYRIVEFLPNVIDISDLKLVANYSYVER